VESRKCKACGARVLKWHSESHAQCWSCGGLVNLVPVKRAVSDEKSFRIKLARTNRTP
jgi:DNA-directed RNA polymerase subunit RPC12/RpoP